LIADGCAKVYGGTGQLTTVAIETGSLGRQVIECRGNAQSCCLGAQAEVTPAQDGTVLAANPLPGTQISDYRVAHLGKGWIDTLSLAPLDRLRVAIRCERVGLSHSMRFASPLASSSSS